MQFYIAHKVLSASFVLHRNMCFTIKQDNIERNENSNIWVLCKRIWCRIVFHRATLKSKQYNIRNTIILTVYGIVLDRFGRWILLGNRNIVHDDEIQPPNQFITKVICLFIFNFKLYPSLYNDFQGKIKQNKIA